MSHYHGKIENSLYGIINGICGESLVEVFLLMVDVRLTMNRSLGTECWLRYRDSMIHGEDFTCEKLDERIWTTRKGRCFNRNTVVSDRFRPFRSSRWGSKSTIGWGRATETKERSEQISLPRTAKNIQQQNRHTRWGPPSYKLVYNSSYTLVYNPNNYTYVPHKPWAYLWLKC